MKLRAKIGVIQLTDQRLRVLVVKTGGRVPTILEHVDEPLASLGNDPVVTRAEHVTLIRRCLKELKHTPSVFMLNVPQRWSVMRLMSVPFKGAKKVRAALTFQLEPYLAIPIEALAIDHLTVGEYEGQTEVFVMGLQKEHVAEQVALLNEAGVTIEGFGLDTVGLSALWTDTVLKDATPQVLVFEHEGVGYLSILRNRSLAYSQRLTSTPDQFSAWSREIQNTLRAFQATSLTPVELTKLTCLYPHIDSATGADLEAQVGMPVEIHDGAQDWMPTEIAQDEDRTTWCSMLGGALSVAGGSFSIAFDRSDWDTQQTGNPFVRHSGAVLLLVCVVLFAQLGRLHLETQKNNAEVERLGQVIWEEFSTTYPSHELAKERPAGDAAGVISFQAMEAAIEQEQSSATALTPDMFNQTSLPNMLKEIALHAPHSLVSLKDIKAIPGTNRPMEISLQGEAKNPEAFREMVNGLNRSPLLTVHKEQRSTVQGKLKFSLVIRLSDDTKGNQ